MIIRRTITSYVWNSVSGNKMVILSNCIRNFFRKFELIGNSVQGENPAPDNPQEIKSAGRKSKNLLNLQKQPDVKETYLGWKVSDGRNVVLSVKDKGNNADITGCYLGLSRTGGSSDGVVWVVNNGSVAVKEVVSKNQYVSVFPSNETTVRKLLERFDIQVEYGNNATDYEPYGYLLDVKVTGKNLLSNKSADWQIGKQTSWSGFPDYPVDANVPSISHALFFMNVKPSTKYTFVNKENDKLWVNRIIECEGKKGVQNHALYQNESLNYNKYTFITNDRTTSIIFQIKKIDNTELLSLDIESIKIMLVEGDIDDPTPYEPYTEQSMQIALNEPLRGIGEYKDVLTKDGIVRKIHEQTLKKEQISMNEYNWDTKRFRLYVNPDKKIDSSINNSELFSNMFKKFVMYRNNPTVYWIISEEEIRSMGITEADSRQVAYEKIKDFVTTNDIVIQYPIVETTLEPLPESVQAQLQALHSENGVTHVFVDSGEVEAGINIEYKYKS